MPIALRRLLIALIAIFAVYLIGANLFLNLPQSQDWVNRKPERFQASWSKGYTWIPGVVTLHDVKLQGHARKVRWQASADQARGSIDFVALLRRELRSPWIQATQVSASADLVEEELLPPPYSDQAWTLHLSAISTSSLQQLRFDKTTIDGTGSGSVAFIKQLRGGPLELLPSRVGFEQAVVTHDGRTALRDGSVELDFSLDRHTRDEAPGLRKLALAHAHLKLDGTLPLLGIKLDAAQRWQGRFGIDDGNARIRAEIGLDKATLQAGSSMEISAELEGSIASHAFNNVATLRAELAGDDAIVQLALPPPPQGHGSAEAELRIAGARLDPPRDWSSLMARSSGRFDMDWHFDALDWLDPLLAESNWLQLRGAGDIKAKLRIDRGVLQNGSSIEIPRVDLGVIVAEHRFHGSARAKAEVVASSDASPGRLEVVSVLDTYDVAANDAPTTSLLRGTGLRLDLDASSDLAQLRDTLKARMQFKRAELPDIRAFNRYLPTNSVVLLRGSNRIDADIRVDAQGKVGTAAITMDGRNARARLGAINLAGNFDLNAKLIASKTRAGYYELDGSRLKVDQLRIGDAGHSDGKPTWVNLALPRSTVKPGKPWTITADADIRMANVRVLLGLFSRERAFPKWVIKLADAGVMQATGLLQMQGDSLVFDRVQASNDRFDAAARMRVRGGRASGDLLLNWGVLSLGLELDGDERDFKLIRARHWYESRPNLLPRPAKRGEHTAAQ